MRQIDRKSQQVEIDARVVQTSRSFAREIGTEFGFSAPTGRHGEHGLWRIDRTHDFPEPGHPLRDDSFRHAVRGSANQIPLNTNLGATAPNSGFTFSTQGHNYAIDFILSLMESRGVGKILSEPKGITQNNEKLTVKQGQQVPIQTNINNTISTQYVDAVLKLEVTPQITAEGTVFLDITVENTQIDKSISVQGTAGPGYAVHPDQSSDQRRRHRRDWRSGGHQSEYDHRPGAAARQRAADRQPVQTHVHQRFDSGVDVLRDPANFAGLSSARYNIA